MKCFTNGFSDFVFINFFLNLKIAIDTHLNLYQKENFSAGLTGQI